MKVTDLIGAHLDYWVARAERVPADRLAIQLVPRTDNLICVLVGAKHDDPLKQRYDPSTNPMVAYPIITREHIATAIWCTHTDEWEAYCGGSVGHDGIEADPFHAKCWGAPTLLVAAMRAWVIKVFGAEVPDIDGAPHMPVPAPPAAAVLTPCTHPNTRSVHEDDGVGFRCVTCGTGLRALTFRRYTPFQRLNLGGPCAKGY